MSADFPESISGPLSVRNVHILAVRIAALQKWQCDRNKAVEAGESKLLGRSNTEQDVSFREWLFYVTDLL